MIMEDGVGGDGGAVELEVELKAQIMAEKFRTSTEILEDFLRCMVCFEPFKAPKVLQCQHTFCEECLSSWNGKGGGGQKGISCPTCRKRTPLPNENNIAGLPSDFKVRRSYSFYSCFPKVYVHKPSNHVE